MPEKANTRKYNASPAGGRVNPFRVVACLMGIVVLLIAGTATAEPAAAGNAKALVDDAVSQYNLGHYVEAAKLFERAYQVDPAPILLFNIGQCHRRLGNHDLALFFYRQYLEQAPLDAPQRADVNMRVADLERTIREQAELKDKPPPGVGGAARGNGPATSAATGLASPAPVPALSPPAATDDHHDNLRTAAWLAGGLAAAALVFGGVEAIVWARRAERFNDHVGPSTIDQNTVVKNCGADERDHGGAGCASLYSDVSTARTLSIVGLVTGGVFAAGSAILFSRSGGSVREHSLAGGSSACSMNLLAASVACRLTF